MPGGGSVGQPGIDVGLDAGLNCPPVGGFEPGEEFDGFGDFLLRTVHGTAGGSPVAREASDAAKVVPAGKGFNRPPDVRVFDGVELADDPPFKEREIVIAVRE